MPTHSGTALAVQEEWKDHFFLSTEEYLHSLISLVNELVSANFTSTYLFTYDSS